MATTTAYTDVAQPGDVKREGQLVLMFVASFHDACQPGGQMDQVLHLLASKSPSIRFYRVDAEQQPDLAEEFAVEVVPTFCFVDCTSAGKTTKCKVVDRVEGAVPALVAERLEAFKKQAAAGGDAVAAVPSAVFKRIDAMVHSNHVFLFMKGSPDAPKCKFSKRIMQMFSDAKVTNFAAFDVLGDEAVRQAVKEYSNWPTFPQLFVGGKLVGGVDIVEEMGSDELGEVCRQQPPPASAAAAAPTKQDTLNDRLSRLINQEQVMLFMKGHPDAPQCGFSAQICKLLKQDQVQFGSFDILSDAQVRQGLKTFSDWPTYPQLYVRGQLVGGLDVVKELAEEDGGLQVALELK